MAEITVDATVRTDRGKNAARRLRKDGMVPAVVYGGKKQANLAIVVAPKSLRHVLHSDAGRNTIFTLKIEGHGKASAIIKDYQVDPVRENILHADFLRIAMDELLRVTVPIASKGEARGVKTDGGILEFVLRAIEVECLPADIPDRIEVDVSDLGINDQIRVSGLTVNLKVKVLEDPGQVVVHVVPPKAEEVPVAAAPVTEEAAAPAEPEVIKKVRKKEEEEPAETEGRKPKAE